MSRLLCLDHCANRSFKAVTKTIFLCLLPYLAESLLQKNITERLDHFNRETELVLRCFELKKHGHSVAFFHFGGCLLLLLLTEQHCVHSFSCFAFDYEKKNWRRIFKAKCFVEDFFSMGPWGRGEGGLCNSQLHLKCKCVAK